MNKTARHIHLLAGTGSIRTATFEGDEYTVVPLVALVEGVIRPLGSKSGELVLAEEFSIAPEGWNGRPVMMNHPIVNGEPVSANTPTILEAQCIGTIFGTKVVDKQLRMEAWVRKAKVASMGGDAVTTHSRILANEMVEVSVGVIIVAEQASGIYNGKSYGIIWREITQDHVAFLSEGQKGACSIAMGCGTPRAATYLVTAEGLREVEMPEPAKRRTLRERWKDAFRSGVKGFSQSDVRNEIRDALKAIEPLYRYIEDVWESDGYVVYSVIAQVGETPLSFSSDGYPNEPYTTKMYRRDFTMTKDAAVTFSDTRVEVEPVVYFEPVTAAESRAACECGRPKLPTAVVTQPSAQGDSMATTKAERITALMANEFNPLKDQKALEAADEKGLAAMEAHVANAKTLKDAADAVAAEAKAAADKKTADEEAAKKAAEGTPKVLSEAEYLADPNTPKFIKDMYAERKAAEDRERGTLVVKMKDAQKVYDEAALKAMPIQQLRDCAMLMKVEPEPVNYAGTGRAAREGDSDYMNQPPPDGYRAAIDARNGKKSEGTVQ